MGTEIKHKGRPKGTTKDPNRLRILNHNNRLIDVNGPQYKRLMSNGYIPNEDNTRLIKDTEFIGEKFTKRNRGSLTISNTKVENPITKRRILVNGSTFKHVLKLGYTYDEGNNSFAKYLPHPKHDDKKILKDGDIFKSFIKRGYIFDEESNSFIVPSVKTDSAFKNGKVEYDLTVQNKSDVTVQTSLMDKRIKVLCKRKLYNNDQSIKINIGMDIFFSKQNSEGILVTNQISLKSKATTINNPSEIKKGIRSANEQLFGRIDRFTNNGSGWSVDEIRRHYLHIVDHSALSARSYIELPSWIQNKKATINIKNQDSKCFIYCLARVLDPNPEKKNLDRISKHLLAVCRQLNLNNIKVPVSVKNIPKIEKDYNISINIYGHTCDSFTVIRTTQLKLDRHIDLLYTSNDETQHYVWIKNFDKLMFKITKDGNRKYFCKHCLQHFTRQDILEKHIENCVVINGSQAVEMPKEGSTLSFTNARNSIACPFAIYADLEAILEPIHQSSKSNIKFIPIHRIQ